MKNLFKYLSLVALAGAITLAVATAEDDAKKTDKKKVNADSEEASKPSSQPTADPPRGQRPGGPPPRRPDDQRRRPGGPGGLPAFSDIDANNDGSVSKDEWTAFHVAEAKKRAERSFGFVDDDQNGSLTEKEVKTATDRMRDRMRGGDRRPGPPGANNDRRPGPPPDQGGNRPPRPAADE